MQTFSVLTISKTVYLRKVECVLQSNDRVCVCIIVVVVVLVLSCILLYIG